MTQDSVSNGEVNALAEEALNKTIVLKCHSTKNKTSKEQEIHIVGTAHISKKSCNVVRHVIQTVQPEVRPGNLLISRN